MSDKDQGDFRYAKGDAKVPWHAVGERFDASDVVETVRFLLPKDSDGTQYDAALEEAKAAITRLASVSGSATKLTLGKRVEEAENQAREYLGVKHACYLTNWTAGMEIGFKLSGLQAGDEVIVPSMTFIATMAYPLAVGAKVVFCDVDPTTANMCPKDLARKITDKTRVIVPVHIGGYACDMDAIMALADEHDIYVMEDAAHALGATYKGQQLGTIGQFGGYSMHEVKNINSFGEGGLLVSNSDLGEQFKHARFLGLDFTRTIPSWLYDVVALKDRFGSPQVPSNHSAMEIQGLGFSLQLGRLDQILEIRRRHAGYLTERFAGEEALLPPVQDTEETRSSHHLYPLRIDPGVLGADIQELKKELAKRGITEIVHFGPMYEFDILKAYGYNAAEIAETCPNTERVFYHELTHLPLYPLSQGQLEYMADCVLDSVQTLRAGCPA